MTILQKLTAGAAGMFIIAILLVACGENASSEKLISEAVFECSPGNSVDVKFYEKKAMLKGSLNGIVVDWSLPQVQSASGARYSDGIKTFWNKGDSAMIDVGEGVTFNCGVRGK